MRAPRHSQCRGPDEGSQDRGHVFVVHGRLEKIVHDVAVVPTDGEFRVEADFGALLGASPEEQRPAGWSRSSEYDASRRDPSLWFLNVGSLHREPPAAVVERAVASVRAIAEAGGDVEAGRARRLVALPFVGLEGGGQGQHRGEVIEGLLSGLRELVEDVGVDVALVTPEPAVHAAAQHHRRTSDAWPSLAAEARDCAVELGRLAAGGELALFFGAGVSAPAGLPTWRALLEELASGTPLADESDDLSPLDQAQLLAGRLDDELGKRVVEITRRATRPSLAHALLAALGCREAVTTNYDRLYEDAILATGGSISTLPHDAVGPDGRWVLKLHGDVERPDTIVLTRADFVRYDALTRPSASILQSLLLTRHVLVVGASLTDDNVVRLAYEVEEYRRKAGLEGPYGTLLDVDDKAAMADLWQGQLHWESMRGGSFVERARTLEVFLDMVAARATASSPWLLDPRFGHLLGSSRAVAERARELYGALPDEEPWEVLKRYLRSLGAR